MTSVQYDDINSSHSQINEIIEVMSNENLINSKEVKESEVSNIVWIHPENSNSVSGRADLIIDDSDVLITPLRSSMSRKSSLVYSKSPSTEILSSSAHKSSTVSSEVKESFNHVTSSFSQVVETVVQSSSSSKKEAIRNIFIKRPSQTNNVITSSDSPQSIASESALSSPLSNSASKLVRKFSLKMKPIDSANINNMLSPIRKLSTSNSEISETISATSTTSTITKSSSIITRSISESS